MKKSGFAVAAVIGLAGIAAVPLGVSPTKAQDGTASLGVNATTNTTTDTIQFGSNPPANNNGIGQVIDVTGNLVGVWPTIPMNVGMIGGGAPVNYTTPSAWIGTNLFGSSQEDFRITSFNDSIVGNALTLSGTGLFSGVLPSQGTWTLTTQLNTAGGPNPTTFSAETFSVPGPIVGAGLPGLIAALGGLVAIARRRRKQLA